MKKNFILVVVGLFFITSMFATQTRMSGLGNPNGLIADDTDVFTYPATIFANSGVAVGELNNSLGSTDWTMGVNIPILNYKLGVYLNRDTSIDNLDDGTLDISKSVEFNFGFMDKYAIGFGTSYDYQPKRTYSGLNDTETLEPLANYVSFFGGYSANGMDFGFRVETASLEDITEDNLIANMNYTAFNIKGRHYVMQEDYMSLLVQAGYTQSMRELNYKDFDGEKIMDEDLVESALEIGFGLEVKAGDRNRIIFGLTPITYNPISLETTIYDDDDDDFKETEDVTLMFFPEYNLAVESQICSWLTGRIGANQVYAHVKAEADYPATSAYDDFEETWYAKMYNMNLGLTFSFGKFCVDTVLEEELLFDGPEFIGGSSNGLASQVSVKYNF